MKQRLSVKAAVTTPVLKFLITCLCSQSCVCLSMHVCGGEEQRHKKKKEKKMEKSEVACNRMLLFLSVIHTHKHAQADSIATCHRLYTAAFDSG